MPRGNDVQTRVHYKGKNTEEDFIVFVENEKAVQDWKADRSIPLVQVVNGFKIFVTHKYESSSAVSKDEGKLNRTQARHARPARHGVQEHAPLRVWHGR